MPLSPFLTTEHFRHFTPFLLFPQKRCRGSILPFHRFPLNLCHFFQSSAIYFEKMCIFVAVIIDKQEIYGTTRIPETVHPRSHLARQKRQPAACPCVLQGQTSPALHSLDLDREERRTVRRDCRVGIVCEGQRDARRRHQPPLGGYQRADYPHVQRREDHFHQH